ncbi:hypothetical protein SFRURICE_002155 [Spodoptera frugiperda]|nr:hypothetical protein SFRURICE_002155 [Spodoptera frugiperda]
MCPKANRSDKLNDQDAVARDTPGVEDRATISGRRKCGSMHGEQESLAARPEPNKCVQRVAFRTRLIEPSDHHRWGPVGLMLMPELRTA